MNYFMCEEQLKNRIRKTGMLGGQDRVLCGLSGGADSVFLFLLLRDLSEEIGFALRAVHVHHGIRGADADDDAAFVRDLCEEKGIPLRVFKRDIPKEAKERGMSYSAAVILKWLKKFYSRFFTQQFKRSCLPDGPKVGSVGVSPRGDLQMPSDAAGAVWMRQLEELK